MDIILSLIQQFTINDYDLCLTWKVFGCTDSTAVNFNENANVDDECAIYLVEGCTDASACNYNADADVDDSSCEYPAEGLDCEGNCLSGALLTMEDSYGDGWNGAVLTINGVDYTVDGSEASRRCVRMCYHVMDSRCMGWRNIMDIRRFS